MTKYSKERATELKDAIDDEIRSALKSGADIAEIFAVLGYFLEHTILCMSSQIEREYAVTAATRQLWKCIQENK
jgi:hypothetical protein